NLRHAAFELVGNGDHSGLSNFVAGKAGGFQLFGSQAMPGNVDHIIYATEDAEVAVGRLHCAVAGKRRPIMPVFTVLVAVIFLVILADKALAVTPDGLEDSRPGIANAYVSGFARTWLNLFALFVVNYRINSRHRRPRAARFHGIDARLSAAEE